MMRMLPCDLTHEEMSQRRHELVTTLSELKAHEAKEKQVKGELNTERKEIEKRRDELHKQLREACEMRPVECEEKKNFDQNAVEIVRIDTGDVIEQRAMSAGERQLSIEDPPDEDEDDDDDDEGTDG